MGCTFCTLSVGETSWFVKETEPSLEEMAKNLDLNSIFIVELPGDRTCKLHVPQLRKDVIDTFLLRDLTVDGDEESYHMYQAEICALCFNHRNLVALPCDPKGIYHKFCQSLPEESSNRSRTYLPNLQTRIH